MSKPMGPEGQNLRLHLQKMEKNPENLSPEKVGEILSTLDTAVGVLDLMDCQTTLIVMTRMLGLKLPKSSTTDN